MELMCGVLERYRGPRVRSESVWCTSWSRCHGIGVPGFRGGSQVELCDACQAKEDAPEKEGAR